MSTPTAGHDYAEQRARDALAFDPLPPSPWISVEPKCVVIKVEYSEALSKTLHALPGAKWRPERRAWEYPFAAVDAIRNALTNIDRLATSAAESAARETEVRDARQRQRDTEYQQERQERQRRRAMAVPRALRSEYLHAMPEAPRYALSLEAIGDNNRGGIIGAPARNWVARLFGSDGRGGWARIFMAGARDYSTANSKGSRGIIVTYFLETGPIYEISSPQSWRHTERYFARIVSGRLVCMTKEEVEACLEK